MNTPQYRYEQQQQKKAAEAINVAQIVKVTAYDGAKQTVDVQPISKRLEQGTYQSQPPILGVPIVCDRGGGFAKKVAKGLDLMAFHGVNPRTGTASSVIGTNHFDSKVTQAVTIASGDKPDENIEAAIALVQGADRDVTGMVLAPAFKSALAKQTTADGAKLYPQLAWGANPGEVNGLRVESTSNLSSGSSLDRALVGDFVNCFKWGYAKEIPIEVIRYGNPDNDTQLGDLKGHNQVYLRGEAYIGWGILDPSAFAHIKTGE